MPRQLRVFLCHASQDKPAMRKLYKSLKDEGWIDPWLDEEKLLGGQDFDLEIYKATRDADVIIICLSTSSVAKEGYVNKEIRRVLRIYEEKVPGAIYLIPLRLDECEPSFPELIKLHWVDYFATNGHDKLLNPLRTRALDLNIKMPDEKIYQPRKRNPIPKFDLSRLSTSGMPIAFLFILVAFVVIYLFVYGNRIQTTTSPTQTLTIIPTADTPSRNVTPNPVLDLAVVSDIDNMTMVYVPAGEFLMGSNDTDFPS